MTKQTFRKLLLTAIIVVFAQGPMMASTQVAVAPEPALFDPNNISILPPTHQLPIPDQIAQLNILVEPAHNVRQVVPFNDRQVTFRLDRQEREDRRPLLANCFECLQHFYTPPIVGTILICGITGIAFAVYKASQ